MRVFVALSVMSAAALGLFLMLAPSSAGAQQQSPVVKIGIVDLQEVASRSEVGKASQDRIRNFFEQRRRGLEEKERALDLETQTLQNQQSVLTREAFNARKNDLEQRTLALQQERDAAQGELEEMQQQELDKFARAVGPVIEAIGKELDMSVIIDRRQGIYYFNPELDLTDLVIQKLGETPGDQ